MARAMVLLLFDIDGTLLKTRGAGRDALDEAFRAVHGWERATEGVHIGGSTDGKICEDVGRKYGTTIHIGPVREHYLARLELRLADRSRTTVCPGVFELLDRVHGRAHVALLTGNWEASASLKLAAVGLEAAFEWGAYADDAVDRNHLLPVARARAAARGLLPTRHIILGDTTADIACARAGEGEVIAVETGFGAPAELAAGLPDLQVQDLRQDLALVLKFLQL